MAIVAASGQQKHPSSPNSWEHACALSNMSYFSLVYIYVKKENKTYTLICIHTYFFQFFLLALSGCDTLFSWLTLLVSVFGKVLVLLYGWFFFLSFFLPFPPSWFLAWSVIIIFIFCNCSLRCVDKTYFLCVLDVYEDISCCVLRGFIRIYVHYIEFSSLSLYSTFFVSCFSLLVFCAVWSAKTFHFFANLRKDLRTKIQQQLLTKKLSSQMNNGTMHMGVEESKLNISATV